MRRLPARSSGVGGAGKKKAFVACTTITKWLHGSFGFALPTHAHNELYFIG
jgi:hypothetical protein